MRWEKWSSLFTIHNAFEFVDSNSCISEPLRIRHMNPYDFFFPPQWPVLSPPKILTSSPESSSVLFQLRLWHWDFIFLMQIRLRSATRYTDGTSLVSADYRCLGSCQLGLEWAEAGFWPDCISYAQLRYTTWLIKNWDYSGITFLVLITALFRQHNYRLIINKWMGLCYFATRLIELLIPDEDKHE